MFKKIKSWFSNDWKETKLLFRNLPAVPFAILCIALVVMNVLANKLIVETSWLSLDAGIIVSWVAFLAGDMLVKRFGPKASLKINLAALGVQFIAVVLLTIGGVLPTPVEGCLVTQLFGWSLYLPWAFSVGTLAFIVAILVDVLLNWAILKRFKNRTSFTAYAVASYASTMVAQFVDNFVFGLLFTYLAFGIPFSSLWLFAAAGAVVELLCQIVLSPIGYKISESWRKNGIGQAYVDAVPEAQEVNKNGAKAA